MADQTRVENIRGSDCTGSDGDLSRTYELSYSGDTLTILSITIDNASLNAPDYSYDSVTNIITFTNALYDDSYIRLIYTTIGTVLTGTDYCGIADVERIMQGTSFSATTTPTDSQVLYFINAAEDEIDDYTNHAWRTRYSGTLSGSDTTSKYEYYDIPDMWVGQGYWTGYRLKLKHRKIKDFSNGEGDALEIWNGSNWVDWITTKTEGRANDFWVNYQDGFLYLRLFYPFHKIQAIRIKYRYGETVVPRHIQEATALIASSEILASDDRSMVVAETGDPTRQTHLDRVQQWKARANKILSGRQEINFF